MIIESINLIGFGKFANKTINLNNNFNLLIGANEAGKTTVINAILGILYGFKGRSDDIRNLKAKYKPWDTTLPYQASLTIIDNDGNKYCVTRNFTDDKTEVLLWRENSYMPAGKTITQILEQSLGLNNMRLFASTLLIKQQEISDLDNSNLSQAVLQKITEGGQEVNLKDTFKILTDKQKEYTRGIDRPASNPGLIKSLTDEKERVNLELQEMEKHETEYFSLAQKLKENRSRLNTVTKNLSEIKLTEIKNRILEKQKDLQIKIDQILEKQHLLNKYQDTLYSIKPYAAYLTDFYLMQLEQNWAKCRSIEDSIANYQKRRSNLEQTTFAQPVQNKSGVLTSLIIIFLGLSGFFLPKPLGFIISAIIVSIGIVWLLINQFNRKIKPDSSSRHILKNLIVEEEAEIEKLKIEKNNCQSQINDILNKTSSFDIADFRKKTAQYNTCLKEYQMLSEAVENLCTVKKLPDLKDELSSLSVELLNINKQIEAINVFHDHKEINDLTEEKSKLEAEKTQLSNELIRQETQFKHYSQDLFKGKDIWSLRNSLTEIENQLNKYYAQNNSIELAVTVLQESIEEAQSQLAPHVQSEVSKILSAITGNRYQQIRIEIENSNLLFQILAPEKEDYIDVENLSTGTRDQFYLALRIALGQYLTNNKKFPLFLDDPFVNFDQQRLFNTIKVLEQLGVEQQVIWLTKDTDIGGYLPNITADYL